MSLVSIDTQHVCLTHGFSQTQEQSHLTSLKTVQPLPLPRVPDGAAPQYWLHTQELMAAQKGQIQFSWIKKVTPGMDTSGGQCDPFLMCMILSSAGIDDTASATLPSLNCWARASDLS